MTTTTATATNSGNIAVKVGKGTTHIVHVMTGHHANCNGRHIPGLTTSDLAPGETVTGKLCGKCFRHYPKSEVTA